MKTIGVIGAGSLGSKIIDLLMENGHYKIIASRPNLYNLENLKKKHENVIISNNNDYVAIYSDIIILGVKPNIVLKVLNEIKPRIKDKLVISIAASIKLKEMEKICPETKFIRIMTGIFPRIETVYYTTGTYFSNDDHNDVRYIFGQTQLVPEKELSDRTWLATENGLLAIEIEEKIKALNISSADARKVYSGILKGIAEAFESGKTGYDIFDEVAGKGDITESIYKSYKTARIYERYRRKTSEVLKKCWFN